MADRALITQVISAGVSREDAEEMVERVFCAMREQLLSGKTVGIDGIGRLAAPQKAAWLPSSGRRQAVLQRKVSLRHPAIIERSAPYDPSTSRDPA